MWFIVVLLIASMVPAASESCDPCQSFRKIEEKLEKIMQQLKQREIDIAQKPSLPRIPTGVYDVMPAEDDTAPKPPLPRIPTGVYDVMPAGR